jgi:hypothetical protein
MLSSHARKVTSRKGREKKEDLNEAQNQMQNVVASSKGEDQCVDERPSDASASEGVR